jgi:hypothetical protein
MRRTGRRLRGGAGHRRQPRQGPPQPGPGGWLDEQQKRRLGGSGASGA